MMETVSNWWRGREPREHVLISVAVLLSVVLGFHQLVWNPAMAFQQGAERAYETALVDYALVQQAARRTNPQSDVTTAREPLQTVLTSTAGLYGLTISRLRPAENDGMNLWLDTAPPQLLYAWLSELELRHGVRVERAALRITPDAGTVSANLYVQRRE